MYIKKIPLYHFSELSEAAQDRVVKNELEQPYGEAWLQYDILSREYLDEAKASLENNGFEDVDIEYTGFWSQGDGASFTAKNVDIAEVLNLKEFCKQNNIRYSVVKAILPYLEARIERTDHHYSHAYTVKTQVYDYQIPYYERIDKYIDNTDLIIKLENAIDDIQVEKSNQIYHDLEKLNDNCYNEDNIKNFYLDYDTEYYFDKDGNFYGNADEVEAMERDL